MRVHSDQFGNGLAAFGNHNLLAFDGEANEPRQFVLCLLNGCGHGAKLPELLAEFNFRFREGRGGTGDCRSSFA
jgi:hypothetical protein